MSSAGYIIVAGRDQTDVDKRWNFEKIGLFTVHVVGSVQMVTVSYNPGFKWFAFMVYTLLRLKTDGSEEARFAAIRFTVPDQICGLITVRFTIPG